MYIAILCCIFMTVNFADDFYITHQRNAFSLGVVNRQECRSAVETFKKGVRCCYSSNNDGNIDTCSPYDSNNVCFTPNLPITEAGTYQFFENYSSAKSLCEAMGRRLCTASEYASLCPGSGCGVDALEGWTSDACDPSFKTYDRNESPNMEARNGKTDLAAVRCCTLEDSGSTAACFSNNIDNTCWYNDDFFSTYTGLSSTNQELVSYTEAARFCEEQGRRLCDYDIIANLHTTTGVTDDGHAMKGCLNSGCQTNNFYTWSRTSDSITIVPNSPTGSPTPSPTLPRTCATANYPYTYNLIDADPSCRYEYWAGSGPECPLIYNGPGDVDVMAIHPNIQERTDYLMRNMARLFPIFYKDSEWGWGGGSGTYAGNCHIRDPAATDPFYFMSEAVQAARWNSFSGATTYSNCSRGTCGQTSHFTCCDYCQYNVWNQCGFKYRTRAIIQPLFCKNAWNDIGSEGIWSGNTAFITSASHCGMVFNYEYNHQGIGAYPGGATTMVGIKDTEDWEDHVFPHATHFDWSRNGFTFLVQFFGGKQVPSVSATNVYLLYKGQAVSMSVVTSNTGASGFYRSDQPLETSCEPYAFIAKDQNGNWWRLPEDEEYYFGTVDHPTDLIGGSPDCDENHYFNTGTEWVANGAPGLTNAKNTAGGCVGCSKIVALETVYNNRDSL